MDDISSPTPISPWWKRSLSKRQAVIALGSATAIILLVSFLGYTRLMQNAGYDALVSGTPSRQKGGGG
ncbi:MAG: hypothetical protein Kow0059_20580 [Candidatus Sumerlaeia bacterium]